MATKLEDARHTADEVLELARERLTDMAEQANEAVPGLKLPVPKKKHRLRRVVVLLLIGAVVFAVAKQVSKSSSGPSSSTDASRPD